MTVLTVPSTGAKPDKEPLVPPPRKAPWDCYLVGLRPPPEGASTAEKIRQSYVFAWRMVLYIMVAAFIGLTVMYIATCYPDRESRASENRKLLAAAAAAAAATAVDPVPAMMLPSDADSMPALMMPSDADALSALLPSDADALSALMPSAAAAADDDDDLFKRYEGLARFLGSRHSADGRRPPPPPPVAKSSARFIHDFSVNVTGVVDVEGRRCFVMPLVRDSVVPPSSLYDLLFKMSSGYYSMDMQKVMGGMRVVKPAVRDLSPYGMYIAKDCADKATYRLEKADVASTTAAVATDSSTTPHAALDRTVD